MSAQTISREAVQERAAGALSFTVTGTALDPAARLEYDEVINAEQKKLGSHIRAGSTRHVHRYRAHGRTE